MVPSLTCRITFGMKTHSQVKFSDKDVPIPFELQESVRDISDAFNAVTGPSAYHQQPDVTCVGSAPNCDAQFVHADRGQLLDDDTFDMVHNSGHILSESAVWDNSHGLTIEALQFDRCPCSVSLC